MYHTDHLNHPAARSAWLPSSHPRHRPLRSVAPALAFALLVATIVSLTGCDTTPPSGQPRMSIDALTYQGAFRLADTENDVSRLGNAVGVIGLGADGDSLFVAGHQYDYALAELPLTAPSRATSLDELPVTGDALQNWVAVADRAPSGNPQGMDRYGGMVVVDDALVVNGYEYYDAAADNSHTTLAITDASRLADAPVVGWEEMTGAAHAAGWLSPIPAEWQDALGGSHISGQSSGIPIHARASIGPSAFAVDLDPSLGAIGQAEALMDFPLATPLHDGFSTETNDLWTTLSQAAYGFIVPGTSTYLTIGSSGGHQSGVGYGIAPYERPKGNFANDKDDYSPYYWLWDVNDFVDVRNGVQEPHELRPYDYGEIDMPFLTMSGQDPWKDVAGATFDPATSTLYVSITGEDYTRSRYEYRPVILTFSIATPAANTSGASGNATP